MAHRPPFSSSLHDWLKSDGEKTLAGLVQEFGEKSFAIVFLILMALPALPIPTGGVTHVTELITIILSLELIAGRKTIWLPQRWLKLNVSKLFSTKAVIRLVTIIQWFEKFSRRRGGGLLVRRDVGALLGLVILVFTLAAFVAPPFSGLDTLPALGVMVIALALILEDSLIVAVGIVVGAIGILLEIAAGTALYNGLTHFL